MQKCAYKLSMAEFAQLKIAKASLKMSPLFAKIGGMPHNEALKIIHKLNRKKRDWQQTSIYKKS